jgi:transcriptional regulator with PAS, ATPase and Fis domain
MSKRAEGPFVAINCASIPEDLLESELFGHEKGAFTGAVAQKKGKFELANGGTFFMDELGELSLPMQAKLLRVVESREIERVGGTHSIKVDNRFVAATNRNLKAMVGEGRFREDLYFRLQVVEIETPPLRDRVSDIPALARYFVEHFSREANRNVHGITPEAERVLQNYGWRGNVRELRNVIERAVVLGSTEMIVPEDLRAELQAAPPSVILPWDKATKLAQRDILIRALARTIGNKSKARELLGLAKSQFYRLMKEFGIE